MVKHENLARLLAERACDAGWYGTPVYYATTMVTDGEIHDGAARVGEVLRDYGLSRGDRVLLCLPDSPQLVQMLLACLACGALAVLTNPDLHPEDHAFQQRDVEPALVVTSAALGAQFQRRRVVDVGTLLHQAAQADPGGYEPVSGETPAYATYTSGTTGTPKAAIHRHEDPLIFVDAYGRRALQLTPEDVGLGSARMYFAYGLGNSIWFPLGTGSSAVINKLPMTAERTAEQSARFAPSVLYGVPTLLAQIVEACSPESFRSLRCLVSAGEALSVGLAERLLEFFDGIPILDGIGSTEVGNTFVSNTVD